MSYYQQANQVMRDARADLVIDTELSAISKLKYGKASIYKSLMDATTREAANTLVNSPWLGSQSSWQLPQTRRYLQSKAPSVDPIVQPVPGTPWMVELARFSVQHNSIGIIKGFEQYLAQDQTVFTASENWGDPFSGVTVRWYFRLSEVARAGAPWINVSGASAIVDYLPGTPYDDLASTSNLWFPAGSVPSANIHLPIPGGKTLRLIAIVSAAGEAVSIAAKLVGTTQLELNKDAQFMVRTTW